MTEQSKIKWTVVGSKSSLEGALNTDNKIFTDTEIVNIYHQWHAASYHGGEVEKIEQLRDLFFEAIRNRRKWLSDPLCELDRQIVMLGDKWEQELSGNRNTKKINRIKTQLHKAISQRNKLLVELDGEYQKAYALRNAFDEMRKEGFTIEFGELG